eukprot:gi/632952709/ref/XP_007891998.1/ PREDICTED: otoancorin [Callorhinchus milii]
MDVTEKCCLLTGDCVDRRTFLARIPLGVEATSTPPKFASGYRGPDSRSQFNPRLMKAQGSRHWRPLRLERIRREEQRVKVASLLRSWIRLDSKAIADSFNLILDTLRLSGTMLSKCGMCLILLNVGCITLTLNEDPGESTVEVIENLRQGLIFQNHKNIIQYVQDKGSSLSKIQGSLMDYYVEIILNPRQLAADLKQMETPMFLLAMKYLLSNFKEQFFLRIDFGYIKSQILQSPRGNRSLFDATWSQCVSALSTPDCAELLIEMLKLSSGLYLRSDMVTSIPKDLEDETFKTLALVFKELYDQMSARTRRAVYEWMRQVLQKSHKAKDSWITAESLWVLGRYIVHLPLEEIKKISPHEIRLFINYDNATKQMDSVYDITLATAKAFQERINASGFDLTNTSTVYRLGLLVCFYHNVQELDAVHAQNLLHQMIKCSRLRTFQADVKQLKSQLLGVALRNQTLNNMLVTLSDAIAGLTSNQLESLSSQAVRNAISILGAVTEWTQSQMIILVNKFLGNNKHLSLYNISQLSTLVPGVGSDLFYNMSAGNLSQAVKGMLSEQASQLTPTQRLAIITKILEGKDVSSVLDLFPGSFLKEVPLINLLKIKTFNISSLHNKELRRSQALYLFNLLAAQKPIPKIISVGELIKGLTCEHIESLNNITFLQTTDIFQRKFHLLSPHQIHCLAQKYHDVTPLKVPALFLHALPAVYLDKAPPSICSPLLITQGKIDLEMIPNSVKSTTIVEKVLQCLNYTVRDEYDVDLLGRLICDLPPGFIKTNVSRSALAEMFSHFRSCRALSTNQRREINNQLELFYGAPTEWQPELIQDLGPLVTLLAKDDLVIITQKFPDLLFQLASGEEWTQVPREFLAVVFDAVQSTNKELACPECSGITAPSFDHILKLGDANAYWSAQQLRCMTIGAFTQSVEVLGGLSVLNLTQLAALKDKAKTMWGPVSTWRSSQVVALGRIALSLNEEEIKALDLSSIDTVAALSQLSEWTPAQARGLLEGFLHDSGQSVGALKGSDLVGLGVGLCEMNGEQISSLSAAAYSAAAARIGEISCRADVLRELWKKARSVYGNGGESYNFFLQEVGTVAAGISGEELKELNENLMPYFHPKAIAALPSHTFTELSPEQLGNLGVENAAAVTASQRQTLNAEQMRSLQSVIDGIEPGILPPTPPSAFQSTNRVAFNGGNVFLLWTACIIHYITD